MSQPNQTIFTDTNCFIHLRDLKDLPWRALFPHVQWIEVVIAPIVIEELDRLKVDRDGRGRDRSRQALALIEKASGMPDLRLTLRESPIKVSLRLASSPRPDWDSWPLLDSSRADDQLIAAALMESRQVPCALLSYDTGPLIRARMTNLPAHRSPDDWQLPEQPDQSSQEIARLKRELEAARAIRPTISARFVLNGEASTNIVLRIPRLPPLPVDSQKALAAELIKRNPKASLRRARGIPSLSSGYSDYTIGSYDSDYEEFIDKAAEYFGTLHDVLARSFGAMEIQYVLENVSAVTALNLLIQFESSGDSVLLASAEDAESPSRKGLSGRS